MQSSGQKSVGFDKEDSYGGRGRDGFHSSTMTDFGGCVSNVAKLPALGSIRQPELRVVKSGRERF